jgi:hypothetical protein
VGEGQQLDVSLDTPHLALHPTYIDKLSQRSFKLVNRSGLPLSFAVRAAPGSGWEQQQEGQQLRPLQLQAADEELLLADDVAQVSWAG